MITGTDSKTLVMLNWAVEGGWMDGWKSKVIMSSREWLVLKVNVDTDLCMNQYCTHSF